MRTEWKGKWKIIRLQFLSGSEHYVKFLHSIFNIQLCVVGYQIKYSFKMGSSKLPGSSASCTVAKLLPVQPAASCQARIPRKWSRNLMKKTWTFPPSLPWIFILLILLLYLMCIFDLPLHFRNKVSPKQTCPTSLYFHWCRCYSCLWWWSSDPGSQKYSLHILVCSHWFKCILQPSFFV